MLCKRKQVFGFEKLTKRWMLPNPFVISFVPSKIKDPSQVVGFVQVFATEETGIGLDDAVIGGTFTQELENGTTSFSLQVIR